MNKMNKINKITNILFWCGWSLFLIFSIYTFIKTYKTDNDFAIIYKSQYLFYFGLLIWSALSRTKIIYTLPIIWFILMLHVPSKGLYSLPEIRFYNNADTCIDDKICDALIEEGYMKFENGEFIWIKKYGE